MQAVVPKAVRAALMMAASISSPYLIAFLVEVLIAFSVICTASRFTVKPTKTKENKRKPVFSCFILFFLVD